MNKNKADMQASAVKTVSSPTPKLRRCWSYIDK